jgi:hypothetical protein
MYRKQREFKLGESIGRKEICYYCVQNYLFVFKGVYKQARNIHMLSKLSHISQCVFSNSPNSRIWISDIFNLHLGLSTIRITCWVCGVSKGPPHIWSYPCHSSTLSFNFIYQQPHNLTIFHQYFQHQSNCQFSSTHTICQSHQSTTLDNHFTIMASDSALPIRITQTLGITASYVLILSISQRSPPSL